MFLKISTTFQTKYFLRWFVQHSGCKLSTELPRLHAKSYSLVPQRPNPIVGRLGVTFLLPKPDAVVLFTDMLSIGAESGARPRAATPRNPYPAKRPVLYHHPPGAPDLRADWPPQWSTGAGALTRLRPHPQLHPGRPHQRWRSIIRLDLQPLPSNIIAVHSILRSTVTGLVILDLWVIEFKTPSPSYKLYEL